MSPPPLSFLGYHILAVIRSYDDHGAIKDARRIQPIYQLANTIIQISEFGVIQGRQDFKILVVHYPRIGRIEPPVLIDLPRPTAGNTVRQVAIVLSWRLIGSVGL